MTKQYYQNETEELLAFFGCSVNQIDPMNYRLFFIDKPEWLRGKPRYNDLPRNMGSCYGAIEIVPFTLLVDRDIIKRLHWIIDTLHGGWALDESGFGFELKEEAAFFRLRF